MHIRHLVIPCSSFFALALLTGCGDSSGMARVRGTVKLDGQPVEGALVTFIPLKGAGRPASGQTDKSGQFQLTTLNPGDGAMPGEYKATVVYDEPPELSESAQGQEKAFAAVSKARAKRGKPKYVIPTKYSDPGQTPLKFKVPTPGPVTLDIPGT